MLIDKDDDEVVVVVVEAAELKVVVTNFGRLIGGVIKDDAP
jgi:hypothetical protein